MSTICFLFIFALTLTEHVTVQEAVEGNCMLQKGSTLTKTSPLLNLHENWRNGHQLLLTETTKSMDVLEEFMAKQLESGNACSARLMASKRALDGLLHDLKSLSTQVISHERVLETETEDIQMTETSVNAVKIAHKEDMAVCEKEKQDLMEVVSQYRLEIDELNQIAKPSVRYDHATTTKVQIENTTSFMQQGVWTKDSCAAFLQFQKQRRRMKKEKKQKRLASVTTRPIKLSQVQEEGDSANTDELKKNDNVARKDAARKDEPKKDDPRAERDCEAYREELQEAFKEAYISTANLLKQSQADVEDATCKEAADARQASSLVPLVAERERALAMIESSTMSLAGLTPVLKLIQSRVGKLKDHIYNVLTPECAEAKEASGALQKIRTLILDLEECPGRKNFKLQIPNSAEEPPENPGQISSTHEPQVE